MKGTISTSVSFWQRFQARGLSRYAKLVDLSKDASKAGGFSLVDFSISHTAIKAANQNELVDGLVANGVLKDDVLRRAMAAVDRALFIPIETNAESASYAEPYANAPQVIDPQSKSTISAPFYHCQVGELATPCLADKDGEVDVLDLGTGTGYLAVLFATVLGELKLQGSVLGLDAVPDLVGHAEQIRQKFPVADFVRVGHAFENEGQSSAVESMDRSFDLINVGFGLEEDGKLFQVLVEQRLKPGGTLIAPILSEDGGTQHLATIKKEQDQTLTKFIHQHNVHCQQMFPATFQCGISPKERLEEVKRELEQWKQDYIDQHGKPPSKTEMLTDPTAIGLFKEFQDLRKRKWD